ncbi:MAG: MATE family efflux transporter [Chloroflexi bacterium]|nr:MATE family efflux transporter [Chloroflexota bacterium]
MEYFKLTLTTLMTQAGRGLKGLGLSRVLGNQDAGLMQQLYNLAWPSLIENLLQTLLTVVDLIFVGRLGADAVAAAGLGAQILYVLISLFGGLAVGNTALVARFIGAGKPKDAELVARQAFILGMIISLVVGVFAFFFSDKIIWIMGGSSEVSQLGGGFLKVTATGSFVLMFMLVGGGTLRGAGDTRTPMKITGFINIINIILSYILVFGNFGFPALGVVGSAWAQTIARAIGSGLMLYVLFVRGFNGRDFSMRLNWLAGLRFDRPMLQRLLNIGGPAALEQVIFNLGFATFAVLTIRLGTNDLAAQQIVFNIAQFSFMPAIAFGVAATTLVGQNLGAGNLARAEQSANLSMRLAVIWQGMMALVFVLWGHYLIAIYTSDVQVIALGSMLMYFAATGQVFQAVAITIGAALRGAGDTRVVLYITVAGVWLMRLGVGWFFGLHLGWGLGGVWMGWLADFVTRAVLVFIRYHTGKWKLITA